MEIADVRVRLDKLGSDVPKKDVTPAEALVLHVIHQANNGGSTYGEEMDKIKVTGEAQEVSHVEDEVRDKKRNLITPAKPVFRDEPRTDVEELKRLTRKYGNLTNKRGDKILNLIFPDKMNPKLPQAFSDLKWKEISFDGLEIGTTDYGNSGGLAITNK